jgi:glutathione synthase/RimK-type ligase-like ATP-grasp enzyme
VIVIVSDRADMQAYVVMLELDRLGVEHGLFCPAEVASRALMTQEISSGGDRCRIGLADGRVVEAAAVRAVWYRKPGAPRLDDRIAEHEKEFAFAEARAGLTGVYDALAGAYWISPLERIGHAANKLRQLRRAVGVGFTIPRTVFTNDVAEARAFAATCRDGMVYKAVGASLLTRRAGPWEPARVVGELFTTVLTDELLEAGLDRLTVCPGLLQERVRKDVELRVTVVGDAVFAAEIASQDHPNGRDDWRRANVYEVEHRRHDLPDPVERACLALVRAFGLEYGAIDLIRTPDGGYVFLEINANGQYGWVEGLTGMPISRAIAERLAAAGS